jgi:small GTP-binding protein
MDASRPREVKLVVLGDTGVGKSSLVLKFVSGNFKPYSESTIGASFQSKYVVCKGQSLKFQIWDTAGQEKYHSLAPMYYRGAAAAVVVYDITRANTFKTLRTWIDELKAQGPKDIAIAIAGNKADMKDAREIESSSAKEYADEIGALFLETSAKDDTNVSEIFTKLADRLPPPPRADPETLTLKASARNLQQQRSSGGVKKKCC